MARRGPTVERSKLREIDRPNPYRSDQVHNAEREVREVIRDEGDCRVCDEPIIDGQLIYPESRGWIHAVCRVLSDEQ
jgi:hypothetical protein